MPTHTHSLTKCGLCRRRSEMKTTMRNWNEFCCGMKDWFCQQRKRGKRKRGAVARRLREVISLLYFTFFFFISNLMPQFTILCVLFIFRSMHLARVNRMTSPVNKQFVQCRPFVRLLVFHIANWIKSIRSEINSLDIIRLVVYMGRCWWFFAFERICYCGICNCDLKSVCGGATSLNMRAALILVFMFITTPQLTLCIYCVCLWCLFLPLSYTSITMLSIFIIQNKAFHAGDGSECIHSIKNDHLRQMRTKKKKNANMSEWKWS